MGTSRMRASERTVDARLDRAAQRIDRLVATARSASDRLDGRLVRRIDALRAHEAQVRTRLRQMREADQASRQARAAALGRHLDELEAALTITGARLDARLATDEAAFAAAVAAELEAWNARIAAVQAAAAAPGAFGGLDAAGRRLHERLAVARRWLDALRGAAGGEALTLRAELSRAVEDLDDHAPREPPL